MGERLCFLYFGNKKGIIFDVTVYYCSMAAGISFDVSLSLNCTDLYKRGGGT